MFALSKGRRCVREMRAEMETDVAQSMSLREKEGGADGACVLEALE